MTATEPQFSEGPLAAAAHEIHAPDESERFARLRLSRSQNVGPRTFGQLLRRFGTAERAIAELPRLAGRGGKCDYSPCDESSIRAELDAGHKAGARLLVIGDPDYPTMLRSLDPAPPTLWARGRIELAERCTVAIVGARNASALGLRTARRISRELGATGYVTVSGLARGIDAAAHQASLETGTIAVLAGGLDQPYPPENIPLTERIAEEGLLISELPMGVVPTAHHFPRRNRLISGLAKGVLLIEAAARSGSLITARFALEQGREAMACPGAPEDPRAAGCNALIREGAALIRHAGDVEECLAAPRTLALAEEGFEFDFDADLFGDEILRDDYDALADFEEDGSETDRALAEQIMSALGHAPTEIDDVARLCGANASELSLALLELDLAGRIELRPGGTVLRREDA